MSTLTQTQDRIIAIGGVSVELNDCPECESRNVQLTSVRTGQSARACFVQCENCGGYTAMHRSPQAAIAEWNGDDQ